MKEHTGMNSPPTISNKNSSSSNNTNKGGNAKNTTVKSSGGGSGGGKTSSQTPGGDEDNKTLSLLSALRTNLVESCMYSVTNMLESIIIGMYSVCIVYV